MNKISIPISIIIAGLMIAGAFVYTNQEKTEVLSPREAAQIAIDYINNNLLEEGETASLVSITEKSGLYKIQLKINNQEYPSYVTKDGKFLFPFDILGEGIDLESDLTQTGGTSTEVPKSDKPDVKLFVMSYCPYGLQAQKMFLPVYDLLKDKADMGVYFVYYIMHGEDEIDENLTQYCIQKEEKEKFSDYLSCFVVSGDSEDCLSQANINETKLSSCIAETDSQYSVTEKYNDQSTWLSGAYPLFDVDLELNQEYSIGGSPTVIINDQVVNVNPRSPEKFKEVVCQSFNSPPEECSQTLSDEVASTGIGGGTGSSSGGSCE